MSDGPRIIGEAPAVPPPPPRQSTALFGFVPARARYVALRPKDAANAASAAFRDWLVEEGSKTPSPPPAPGP